MRLEYLMQNDLPAIKEKKIPVVIPIGTMEYHGPHCALGCDTMVCQGVLEELEKRHEIVIAPPVWYGVASYAVGGPENGTVQIDKELCIGCGACLSACPYGVRYINEDSNVAEKCTLCSQLVEQGELPACVAQCGARARFFGDLDEGIDSFEGPWRPEVAGTYEEQQAVRVKIRDAVQPFEDDDLHQLPDTGNAPSNYYILRQHYGDRRDSEWRS